MTWSCGVCEHRWPEAVPTCLECLTRERDAAEARVEQLTEALNDYRAELGKVMEYLSRADHTMYKLVQQSQVARLARARAVLVGEPE